MKISIIGAGNVGSLSAMRLCQEGIYPVVLIDALTGVAEGKTLDIQDAQWLLSKDYALQGSHDIHDSDNSDIIIITAGLARKPGMTREELLQKNTEIISGIAKHIKQSSPQAMVLVVTNPLDIMTYAVLQVTGFPPARVFGMGISLDTSRFANLISQEIGVSIEDVSPCVIGTHGEGMLPIPRLSLVKGVALEELLDEQRLKTLTSRTIKRGAEIVGHLGTGSAYFAPSQAIASLVKAIVKDEKRTIGVSTYLEGHYNTSGICTGVPCLIGKRGVEKIIELPLTADEKEAFNASTNSLRKHIELIKPILPL
jgi:malate dehydrogenase